MKMVNPHRKEGHVERRLVIPSDFAFISNVNSGCKSAKKGSELWNWPYGQGKTH